MSDSLLIRNARVVSPGVDLARADVLIAGDRIRYNVITTCIEIYSNEQRCFVDVNDRVLNSLWCDANDDAILEKVKDAFSEASLEEELILKYFRKPKEHESGYFLTTTDILARVSVDVRNQLSTKKVGMALAHLGYRRIWSKTSRRYGYILCENTFQEIDEMRIRDAVENKPLTTD